MPKKEFPPTTKECITSFDKEIDVLHWLKEYFDSRPKLKCPYLDSCLQVFEQRGRISNGQYDTLRSIWNHLEFENVDEIRESS